MQALAAASLVGIDPLSMLRAAPLERAALLAVLQSAGELATERDDALANRIINALARAMKR